MVVEEVNRPLEVTPWFLTRADEHQWVWSTLRQLKQGKDVPAVPQELKLATCQIGVKGHTGTTQWKKWSSITVIAKCRYFCHAVWFLVSYSEEIYFKMWPKQNCLVPSLLAFIYLNAWCVLLLRVQDLKFLHFNHHNSGISPTFCLLSKVAVHQSERLNAGMHLFLFTSLLKKKQLIYAVTHKEPHNPVKLKF